uniref:Hydrophobin n=1 Tax=Dictyonema glabratum TaxID=164459 RepID=Q8WZJ2_9AGAR|nr:hydrophobin 2 [Dictyonema glabratum]
MLIRVTAFTILALTSSFVGALPSPAAATIPASQCNTGSLQCCQTLSNSSNSGVTTLSGLLGIVIPANVPVGLTCNPISLLVGIGGNSCSAQPVCCQGNNFNGLIVLGCTPVNLNL